ncbi:MAG: LptF/LptG family permease [Planctomycetota bacterium]
MRLLDRAIAKEYFINTVTLFVVLLCFVVAIDVSLNIDRFVKAADAMATRDGGSSSLVRRGVVTAFLVVDFWWPKLLQLYNYLLGVVLVGAMGFTCAQLVRRRELVAMLAAGQPLQRVARPILLVALAFTGLGVLNQELLLPRVAPLVTRDHGEAGAREMGVTQAPLVADSQGRHWYARVFDADRGTLEGVHIWQTGEDGKAGETIRAESARWRDGGWDLTGGVEGRRTPRSRIETNLDPTTLRMRRFSGYAQALSYAQLGQMIRTLDRLDTQGARTRVERDRLQRFQLGRFAVMVSNLLALVIAMTFFLTRLPTNMMLQSLKCAPWAGAALLGGVIGASVAVPGIPASISVFLPVLVLAPLALAFSTSVKT